MKHRFYLVEEKDDGVYGTFLGLTDHAGFATYSEAKRQAENEIRGRRKGKSITIMERFETFTAPPSDVVSDEFNRPG